MVTWNWIKLPQQGFEGLVVIASRYTSREYQAIYTPGGIILKYNDGYDRQEYKIVKIPYSNVWICNCPQYNKICEHNLNEECKHIKCVKSLYENKGIEVSETEAEEKYL